MKVKDIRNFLVDCDGEWEVLICDDHTELGDAVDVHDLLDVRGTPDSGNTAVYIVIKR